MRLLVITANCGQPADGSSSIYLTELLTELVKQFSYVAVYCAKHEGFGSFPHAKELSTHVDIHLGLPEAKSRYGSTGQPDNINDLINRLKIDAVLVNNLNNILPTVRRVGARHGLKIGYIPYDFGIMCPRTNLLQIDNVICEGHESAVKCSECIKQHIAASAKSGYWLANLAPSLYGRIKPSSPWPSVLRNPPAFFGSMKETLRRFDFVFCPSKIMYDSLLAYGGKQSSLRHLPYGVSDLRRIRTGSAGSGQRVKIAYMGHAGQIKGFAVLLKAIRHLDRPGNLSFHIYNSQIKRNTSLSEAERQTIVLHDSLSPWKITEAYAENHAVVVPSIWHENSPFVVLEALANGRPVIASDVKGISEHVKNNENGFLFEAGSADGLTAILRRIDQNPDTIKRLSRNCSYDFSVMNYAERIHAAMDSQ